MSSGRVPPRLFSSGSSRYGELPQNPHHRQRSNMSPTRRLSPEKGGSMLPLHRVTSARVQRFPSWRWSQLIAYVTVACVLAWGFVTYFTPMTEGLQSLLFPQRAGAVPEHVKWSGFDNLETLFVFGGDWSMTGFDVEGTQPDSASPLGNPLMPNVTDPGYHPKFGPTGPLWIHYATLKYNRSVVRTFDFAKGGATLDRNVIEPLFPTANTFGDQIEKLFIPHYAPDFNMVGWSPATSLFVAWFGINDFILKFHNNERAPVAELIDSYRKHLIRLYQTGARNFLMFNLPPLEKPYKFGTAGVPQLKADILDFNRRLWDLRNELIEEQEDMNIFFYDVNAMFDKVLTKPSSYLATMDLQYTRGPCKGYELPIGFEGVAQLDRFELKCGIPVNQYFWHDDLHVTYKVHDAIAVAMIDECMGSRPKGFCS